MTKDEALRLAWDALQQIAHVSAMDYEYQQWAVEAITAIKESLANEALDKMAENARELGLDYEPEQEPVGEIVDAIEGAFKCSFTKMLPVGTKLYTTPPQRKPLTDEEIQKCYETTGHYQTLRPQDRFAVLALARAIEAAHGIKEKNT